MPKVLCNVLAALFIAVLISSNVLAAAPSGKKPGEATASFSLTPTVGGYLFASPQNLDPAIMYGIKASYDIIGVSIADSLGLEGTANYFTTKGSKTGSSVTGYLFRADALFLITPREKIVPFIAVGAGDLLLNENSKMTSSALFNCGAGVKYFLEDWLALRVDARQLFVYRDVNTRNNFELSVGLTYVFGKEHKKKEKKAPEKKLLLPVPAIPDVDEPSAPKPEAKVVPVLQRLDVLGPAVAGISSQPPPFEEPPALPIPLPLAYKAAAEIKQPESVHEKEPAPAAPQTAPAQPPAGSKAPAVEPQAVVGEKAPAAKPSPEGTPAPQEDLNMELALVEIPEEDQLPTATHTTSGRPVKFISRVTIEFDFASSAIRPAYSKQIALLSETLKAMPESVVLIEGHTDSVGKSDPNVALSERRANSVKNELVRMGIQGARIAVRGYGFTRPTAKNSTKQGRQKNRRAVALVTIVTLAPQPPAPAK